LFNLTILQNRILWNKNKLLGRIASLAFQFHCTENIPGKLMVTESVSFCVLLKKKRRVFLNIKGNKKYELYCWWTRVSGMV